MWVGNNFLAKLKRVFKRKRGIKMKNITYQKSRADEKEITDKIFSFLVKSGIENVSIREMCRDTGIAQGSLYYWFEDKDSIVCEATEYGLKKVTDEIFSYVFEKIENLPEFFENCLDKIHIHRQELRFIYQMAASPVYGEKIRRDGKYFKSMYDRYAEILAKVLNCAPEKLVPLVYLFISAICDYAIWEDAENTQTEINYIQSLLYAAMEENKPNENRSE